MCIHSPRVACRDAFFGFGWGRRDGSQSVGGRMFSLDAQITSAAEQDRVVRQRAVKEGAALFLREGIGAIVTVRRELRTANSLAERRSLRLVIVELERLDRQERRAMPHFRPSVRGRLINLLQRRTS